VCWRLARQLATEHGARVTLWIDAPQTLAAIAPQVVIGRTVQGVAVRDWRSALPPVRGAEEAHSVIIAAFGCELPEGPRAALAHPDAHTPLWINLEYLSAEDWVEGCHGLRSIKPADGAVEHFYYPGFTPATGGLLHERGLIAAREAFQSGDSPAEWLRAQGFAPVAGERRISLFCYPAAPAQALLETLAQGARPTRVMVPAGVADQQIERFLGHPLATGTEATRGRLTLRRFALLAQDDYDRLLWSCDLNFVRGEDSWVRAHWADRPFIWQAYPQQDGAQSRKLDAFLERFARAAGPIPEIAAAMRAWNGEASAGPALGALTARLETLAPAWRDWARTLLPQRDLADALVEFCLERL
jgi:uncharacterized repeat protein (TIGR03837 family)